jgi:L-threonylcarbamoyladenylate synthase
MLIDASAPDRSQLAAAASWLRRGELVAFPTETVYGLGARALDPAALARIFAAKRRPITHPLIAHVRDAAEAATLAARWDECAQRLAAQFWPGPLTLVVPRTSLVPAALSGGKSTVAVRAPAHAVAQGLIAALGEPIAAPSANRYQSVSPTTAAHVVKSLGDAVPLVLDGGACTAGLESTVVDLTSPRPTVLRPGAISLAALRAVVPDLEIASGSIHDETERRSPGQDTIHYAPRARVCLAQREEAIARASSATRATGLLLRAPCPMVPKHVMVHALPPDPYGFGQQLYAALHALDDAGVDIVFVEEPPADEAWLAVADRLRRAAGK